MKRYFAAMIIALILGPILLIGLVALAAGHPPNQTALIARAKLNAAQALPSPKIVLVGGSNVMFGFNAKQIERETGIPTINMSLSADLGVDYLLFLTRQALRHGDTVIFAFEYDFYDSTEIVNSTNSSLALWNSIGWLNGLPKRQAILWARNLSIQNILFGLLARFTQPQFTLPVGAFDERGDRRDNIRSPASDKIIAGLDADGKHVFRFNPASPAVESIEKFLKWCVANDVRAMAAWPTLYDRRIDQSAFANFVPKLNAFFASRNVPALGTAAEGLLPAELLYDSPWHANSEGASVRTHQIIEALRRRSASLLSFPESTRKRCSRLASGAATTSPAAPPPPPARCA